MTSKEQQTAIKMYTSGLSSLKIAKELGYCKYTILKYLNKNKVRMRPSANSKRKEQQKFIDSGLKKCTGKHGCNQVFKISEFPKKSTYCYPCKRKKESNSLLSLVCEKCGKIMTGINFDRKRKNCFSCVPEYIPFDIEKAKQKANQYETLMEFYTLHPSLYKKVCTHKVLDEVCGHLDRITCGWDKTSFSELCNFKGNLGTLYLVRLFDNNESFYKVGITSDTCKTRTLYIPYEKKILWEISAAPSLIFDTEVKFKTKIRKTLYSPKKQFGGSKTECFTCHGNCKILREPDIF